MFMGNSKAMENVGIYYVYEEFKSNGKHKNLLCLWGIYNVKET